MTRGVLALGILVLAAACTVPGIQPLANPHDAKARNYTPSTLKVTYDPNGATSGTVPMDSHVYLVNDAASALDNTGTLARADAVFGGWNTQADGKGTLVPVNSATTVPEGGLTLYVYWKHGLTYDGNGSNGGSVPTDAGIFDKNDITKVAENTGLLSYPRSGAFQGWNTKADGSGTAYAPGANLTFGSENITLFAQWKQTGPYSVSYDANGGTGAVPTEPSHASNFVLTIKTSPLPTFTGHYFVGWNTRADGKGTAIAVASSVATPSTVTVGSLDLTFYAQWVPTYTVDYDDNHLWSTLTVTGTLPTDSNVYRAGDSATLAANTSGTRLLSDGYYFGGWNSLADGTGSSFVAGTAIIMPAANLTLYAQWIQMPRFTVSPVALGSFPNIALSNGGYVAWNPNNSVYYTNIIVGGTGYPGHSIPTVAVSGNGSRWTVADRSNAALFWFSTNQGQSWTAAKNPSYHQTPTPLDHDGYLFNLSWYRIGLSNDGLTGATTGSSIGGSSFSFTSDGAANWSPTSNLGGTGPTWAGVSADGQVLASTGGWTSSGSLGGIVVSRDHGSTFSQIPGSNARAYNTGAISADGTTVIGGGTYNELASYVWNGSAWTNTNSTAPSNMVNAPINLCLTADGKKALWSDGTTNLHWWSGGTVANAISIPTSVNHNNPAVKLYSLSVTPDGKTLLAGGENWTFFLSPDGGLTWEDLTASYRAGTADAIVGSVSLSSDGSRFIVGAAKHLESAPGLWIGH